MHVYLALLTKVRISTSCFSILIDIVHVLYVCKFEMYMYIIYGCIVIDVHVYKLILTSRLILIV